MVFVINLSLLCHYRNYWFQLSLPLFYCISCTSNCAIFPPLSHPETLMCCYVLNLVDFFFFNKLLYWISEAAHLLLCHGCKSQVVTVHNLSHFLSHKCSFQTLFLKKGSTYIYFSLSTVMWVCCKDTIVKATVKREADEICMCQSCQPPAGYFLLLWRTLPLLHQSFFPFFVSRNVL